MKYDPETAAAERVAKVDAWLGVLEEAARETESMVLSRPSELASQAGADPDPKLRPCEHRAEWIRGGLCLACDNTALRPATAKERNEGLAYDPYYLNPPRSMHAVVMDQSYAAKRTRDSEALDTSIAILERDARIRSGEDVHERAQVRMARGLVGIERGVGRDGLKVLRALRRLRERDEEVYRAALQRDPGGLTQLALEVSGRIRPPAG